MLSSARNSVGFCPFFSVQRQVYFRFFFLFVHHNLSQFNLRTRTILNMDTNPFMQALSKALLTRLSTTVPTGHLTEGSPAFEKIIQEVTNRILVGNLGTPAPSPPTTPHHQRITGVTTPISAAGVLLEPGTPLSRSSSNASSYSSVSRTSTVLDEAGTPLSRSASNASAGTPLSRSASSCSTISNISNSSNEKIKADDDDDVVFIKRRRPTPDQHAIDSKVVTDPILRHFDAKFLAPNPAREDNPLYEHRVRTGFDYAEEGARPRKKFQDMKMNVFKRESRQILRRLTSTHLPSIQQVDPTVTYEELRRRYEKMALKVVRKRRANHVQSWRPERRGTHRPLIYGGTVPPVRGTVPLVQPKPEKRPVQPKPEKRPPIAPTQSQTVHKENSKQNSKPEKTVDKENSKPEKPVDKENSKSKSDPVAGVEFLVVENGSETEEELACHKCGRQLTNLDAYPKERWGDDVKVWCEHHWRDHQDKMVLQHMFDMKAMKRKQRELEKLRQQEKIEQNDKGDNSSAQDDKGDKQPPSKRQKKNGNVKKCKWCGSTSHFRKSSLQCPFNKKNRQQSAFAVDKDAAAADVDESEEESSFKDDSETEEEDYFHALSDNEEKDKPKAPDAAKPAPKKTDAAKPAPKKPDAAKPAPKQHDFKRGDNVTVTVDKKVYLAQLYKIQGDKYHVYYVENGETGVLSSKQLAPDKFKMRTRAQFLNTEFYCDGLEEDTEKDLPAVSAGRWKVRRIVGNEYVCVRLSGGSPHDINLVNFDIGYVIGQVREEEEFVRERGPFCTGRR